MKRKKSMKRTGFKRAVFKVDGKGGYDSFNPSVKYDPKFIAHDFDAPKKRKPMKRRSDRMRAIYAGDDEHEGRAAFVARILKERPKCEAGEKIGAYLMQLASGQMTSLGQFRWRECTVESVDVHELAKRSHTGSKRKREILTDEANVLAVCRACHDWIETHGKEARALGLAKSKHKGRNDG